MKKLLLIALSIIMVFTVCACGNDSESSTAPTNETAIATSETTSTQAKEILLTVDNVEEYLSFEVSKEYSDVNPDGADHILKVSPLIEGDYSGVSIIVEIPLYDHWYNSYTTEIDLTANINLTKVDKFTAKHPIFCDVADLYETRGIQGEDDPTYIIKSVSGAVK